jgi:xanthine dehydrogenase accessory factor
MASSQSILDFAGDLPRPGVMCTIVKVTGSHPQQPGARMWVTASDCLGTLGGGQFERQVIDTARAMLRGGATEPELRDYILCKQMDQCCGGKAQVFYEVARARKRVTLFGAGHVGRAVAEVLAGTGLEVHLVDPRPEWTRAEDLPASTLLHRSDALEHARAGSWTDEDAVCIFTPSHELDFALVRFFLDRPLGYLGVIGSQHKARVFRARLEDASKKPTPRGAQRDLVDLWDERVHCPIGIPLVTKEPKTIAIAIAAQLLQEWALQAPARLPREATAPSTA